MTEYILTFTHPDGDYTYEVFSENARGALMAAPVNPDVIEYLDGKEEYTVAVAVK